MSTDDDSGSNTSRPVRLATLYLMLADGDVHKASVLAEASGAARRTVYRDIESLRGAGLEIAGTPHRGFQLLSVPELAPLFLTRAERAALVAVAPAGVKAKLRGL